MPAWDDQSAQPCGCDPGYKGEYHCGLYPHCDYGKQRHTEGSNPYDGEPGWPGRVQAAIGGGIVTVQTHEANLDGIHDSGKRIVFGSGSMRDPSEGKIKWSRITFGPMMRRWAQHLTTAEAKYPDPRPGYPNFMLIETEEELVRYKESAFRHFMSWFNGETDEDHAAAVFFNINGVEIIKDKQREGK